MVGLLTDFEPVAGSDSTSLDGSALGTLDGFASAHSATEECFQPSILQSTEGNFQHYSRWPHSMYTPSDSGLILHRYNTRLILDLILLLDRSLLLVP